MGYGAIVRKFYDDGNVIVKLVKPVYKTYEMYLYNEIKVGNMPKVKIYAVDKASATTYAHEICEKYNLVSINNYSGSYFYSAFNNSRYNPPICINIETGEIIE